MPTARQTSRSSSEGERNKVSPHRATDRVLDILEFVLSHPEGVALKYLSAELGAPKSSILPLLRALTARGYLEQGRFGEYRLGQKTVEFGSPALARRELPDVTRPVMTELMKRTGEPVFLAMLISDGSGVIYVDRVESDQVIRYAPKLGERRPMHATAAGKAILAFMPTEQREAILKSIPLSRLTEKTITSITSLRAAINATRESGVCINVEEAVRGGTAVAAPIFNRDGQVIAACMLGAPTVRAKPQLKMFAREVKNAAATISRLMGYEAKAEAVLAGTDKPAKGMRVRST
jgi:IclR family acetate operon transcriptional repressor